MPKSKRLGRLDVFLIIFRHPTYVISTIVSAGVFYYIFYLMIILSNRGAFLVFIPIYLVYLLVLTSGILFSVSVYSISRAVLTKAAKFEGGIASILLPSLGGLVASCGCSFSILASLLIFLGINTFSAVGYISLLNQYQLWIICALIAANVLIIYAYLGKLTAFFRKLK